MNFNLKTYQAFKVKRFLKENKNVIVYVCPEYNSQIKVKLTKLFAVKGLSYLKVINKVSVKMLKRSVFSRYASLITGPVILVSLNGSKKSLFLSELINLSTRLHFVCMRVKLRFYTSLELNKMSTVDSHLTYTNFKKSVLSPYIHLYLNMLLYLNKSRNNVI